MVVMLCIWRSGIGVSILGWDGYIYIYSSGSSVQTAIKAHCIHKAKVPVSKSYRVIADCNPHSESLPPLQVKLK
jgi:hypothetical protein